MDATLLNSFLANHPRWLQMQPAWLSDAFTSCPVSLKRSPQQYPRSTLATLSVSVGGYARVASTCVFSFGRVCVVSRWPVAGRSSEMAQQVDQCLSPLVVLAKSFPRPKVRPKNVSFRLSMGQEMLFGSCRFRYKRPMHWCVVQASTS